MSFPTGLRDARMGARAIHQDTAGQYAAGGETIRKIEDRKSERLGERKRKERFSINNASRENALRTTYH